MNKVQKHKDRIKKIKDFKATSHIKEVATGNMSDKFLNTKVDPDFSKNTRVTLPHSNLDDFDLSVSDNEVNELISSLEKDVSATKILEPVFLGLLDGVMRAFKLGTKQGLTASRLHAECKNFSYEDFKTKTDPDSFTQKLHEDEHIAEFDKESNYSCGKLSRGNEEPLNMRNSTQMKKSKVKHFSGKSQAPDAYAPNETIFENKKHAKSEGKKGQSAEADHCVTLAIICNDLKSNKALNTEDIENIANIDENLPVTSMINNRGTKIGKFDKSPAQLRQEAAQGYVKDKSGKKTPLSEGEITTRFNMANKGEQAQKAIYSATNQTVLKNVFENVETQKRLSQDASNAASNQAFGELILALIKPLYYELNDCFNNGIEEGVGEQSFKSSLTIRVHRMKTHIMENAVANLGGGALNFFKNFLTMLMEGIVNCFVGIFKQVARMIKEGMKILFQISPILRDKNKSPAEKGDAILKLMAGSIAIFSGIGIEAWLNSLGLGEPLSIIIASILTAVLTVLTMHLLDKIDMFGVNRDLKVKRVSEALSLMIEDTKQEINQLIINPLA